MPYCVNCGVKLGDSEEKCPLCQTVVYHPDIPKPEPAKSLYPRNTVDIPQKMKPRFKLEIATIILFFPALLTLICDYSINARIVWSGIVFGAVCLLYCVIFFPLIFGKREPIIYLIPDFVMLLVFERYLENATNGTWFLEFALPVTGSIMFLVLVVVVLKRFTRVTYALSFAVFSALAGLNCILIEFLIDRCFTHQGHFIWSYYPCFAFLMVGLILLVCDRNKRLKERIAQKFFI